MRTSFADRLNHAEQRRMARETDEACFETVFGITVLGIIAMGVYSCAEKALSL